MQDPVELGLDVAIQLRPHKAGFRREDIVVIRVAGPGGIEKTRHDSTIGTIRKADKSSSRIRQDLALAAEIARAYERIQDKEKS